MLNLNQSNHFDVLQEKFCMNLAIGQPAVFTPIEVIVPSSAIEQKLTRTVADRYGICAGIRFSLLAQWLWFQIGKLVPISPTSPFSADILCWRILKHLEEPDFVSSFPRLANYLKEADDLMRFELANRIAKLFERYIRYRPEWLKDWSKGKQSPIANTSNPKYPSIMADQAWQAALWRKIAEETHTADADPIAQFFDTLANDGKQAISQLPQKVHLFTQPAIPPIYIDMLQKLGKYIDIELYVFNPCQEYWFEIVDPQHLAWLKDKKKEAGHEVGNPLLASWGKQARASLGLLFGEIEAFGSQNDCFVSRGSHRNGKQTLLSSIQDAILTMETINPGDLAHTDFASDSSIEIHTAHSLLREIEILHDQILRRLAKEEQPNLSSILVAVPNLDDAAPLIESVFNSRNRQNAIPYQIAGRKDSDINPVAHALIALLDVLSSRFTADAILDLARLPEIAATFGFNGKDNVLYRFLKEAGIRWGLDKTHKTEFGLPEEDRYSFHDGMHRLFLSYALPDQTGMPLAGRIPAGHVSGNDAAVLGQLWHFIRTLQHWKEEFSHPKTPEEWKDAWLRMLDSFLPVQPDTLENDKEVRRRIDTLYYAMADALGDYMVSFPVARQALKDALEKITPKTAVSGTVTFSSMDAMRTLPYAHIYIIGLNDGVFPADIRPDEFDLMPLSPRLSDPMQRDNDKNVFLDLLLAAEKSLYLSYTGQSAQDNSEQPASILIAELLDALLPACTPADLQEDGQAVLQRLVTHHPLQPFSESYFNGSQGEKMASFREDLCIALKETRQKTRPKGKPVLESGGDTAENEDMVPDSYPGEPFFTHPLLFPAQSRQISLEELIAYFTHPARYLIRQLHIQFPRQEDTLSADEPFLPAPSDAENLANRLFPLFFENCPMAHIEKAARAGNEYPPGRLGETRLAAELKRITHFAHAVSESLKSPRVPPCHNSIACQLNQGNGAAETWELFGTVDGLRENGLVRYHYNKGWAATRLDGWLRHLFLNTCPLEEQACYSTWYFMDDGKIKKNVLPPVRNADEILYELIALYQEGQTRPLHFFPRTAWEYVSQNGDLKKAKNCWQNWETGSGEKMDPFNRLAMRGEENPLDREFCDLAKQIFGPLYDALSGKEDGNK